MFWLDTQFDKEGDAYVFFKDIDEGAIDRYKTIKIKWENLFLFKAKDSTLMIPNETMTHGSIYMRGSIGKTWDFYEFKFKKKGNDLKMMTQISNQFKGGGNFYDMDMNQRMRFFEITGLQPYGFIDPYNGINDDEGLYQLLRTLTHLKIEKNFLTRMTIRVKIKEFPRNLIIPNAKDSHMKEFTKLMRCQLNYLEENRIEYIEYLINENGEQKKITFEDNKETMNPELTMIWNFFEDFKRLNPDVINVFNMNELHFLFERCKIHGIKDKFLQEMNRMGDEKPETFMKLRKVSINGATSVLSDHVFDFQVKSIEESTRFDSEYNMFGRIGTYIFINLIGIQLVNHLSPVQLNTSDPNNIIETARLCLEYLDVTMEHSRQCSGHWNGFNNQTLNSLACIRKYNKDLHFLYNPSSNGNNQNSEKIDLGGGLSETFREKGVFLCEDSTSIFDIDYESCYPNIICKYNLGIENIFLSTVGKTPKFKHVTYRIGKVDYHLGVGSPKTSLHIVEEALIKLRKKFTERGEKNKATAIKLIANVLWGIQGMQKGFNPLGDVICANLITKIGRTQLDSLLTYLKSGGIQILLAQTDGCIVKTKYDRDEMKKILEKHSSESKGKFAVAIVKCNYSSFLRLGDQTYVALPGDNEQFEANQLDDEIESIELDEGTQLVKKGAITKNMCPLLKKMRDQMFLELLMHGKKTSVKACVERCQKVLKASVDLSDLYVPYTDLDLSYNGGVDVSTSLRLTKQSIIPLIGCIYEDEDIITKFIDTIFREHETRLSRK